MSPTGTDPPARSLPPRLRRQSCVPRSPARTKRGPENGPRNGATTPRGDSRGARKTAPLFFPQWALWDPILSLPELHIPRRRRDAFWRSWAGGRTVPGRGRPSRWRHLRRHRRTHCRARRLDHPDERATSSSGLPESFCMLCRAAHTVAVPGATPLVSLTEATQPASRRSSQKFLARWHAHGVANTGGKGSVESNLAPGSAASAPAPGSAVSGIFRRLRRRPLSCSSRKPSKTSWRSASGVHCKKRATAAVSGGPCADRACRRNVCKSARNWV